MMNIVDIGCGLDEPLGSPISFLRTYRKFMKGSNVFSIDASVASLDATRSYYEQYFTEEDGINFHYLNYAVTEDPDVKSIPFYVSKEEPTCGMNSLSPDHMRNHGRRDTIEEVEVEAYTVNALLDKLELTQVDRFYVDAEGWDAKILLSLDLYKYLIPFIYFERLHVDGTHQGMEKRGPLATKLLDKFQKFQYAVTPHREWDMIAALEPIHGRDLADTDEVKLDENYRWKN
jgi:FkbM family methyltransferase